MFGILDSAIDVSRLRTALQDPAAGAAVEFEGRARNLNEGRSVRLLEYEAYHPLAGREGSRIVQEAHGQFDILEARCVHRVGCLKIGEVAIWVGVLAAHRSEAFAACRYIVDQIKARVPIWKKEYYADGESEWVNCRQFNEAGSMPPVSASVK